jgi:hypothetical protein
MDSPRRYSSELDIDQKFRALFVEGGRRRER